MSGLIKRIKQAIELRGMTKNAVRVRAGMTSGHLENVLGGKRNTIRADTLLSLAQALNVSTDWLLTGEPPVERYWVKVAEPSAPSDAPAELPVRPRISNSEPPQERAAQRLEKAAAVLRADLARLRTEQDEATAARTAAKTATAAPKTARKK